MTSTTDEPEMFAQFRHLLKNDPIGKTLPADANAAAIMIAQNVKRDLGTEVLSGRHPLTIADVLSIVRATARRGFLAGALYVLSKEADAKAQPIHGGTDHGGTE